MQVLHKVVITNLELYHTYISQKVQASAKVTTECEVMYDISNNLSDP